MPLENFRLIGIFLLIVLPVLAIAGVAVPMTLGMGNLTMLSIYMVVPMFLSVTAYLAFCRNI